MSQKSKILEYLKLGNSLTTASAVHFFKIYRLSERIRELEREGHRIYHESERSPGGANIIRYIYGGCVDFSKAKTNTEKWEALGIQVDLFPDRTPRHTDAL